MTQGYDPIAAARARVGQFVRGKWTLDRIIDVGGMGAVYAATHRNGKRVAIKMLHASCSNQPELRDRFLREGYIANQVTHPGAVQILDDDVAEDGSAFLVMELLIGESLEGRIKRNGNTLDLWDVLPIVERALDVLAAAHDAGVIHRDIKPGNLFVTTAGEVKVLDFGLARARELTFQGSVTRTGMVMGTASYMPPEQARAKWQLVDARSDLWAVGATIFRSVSGEFVHEGETPNDRLIAAMTRQARSFASVAPDAPRSVVELIDRSLAFKKDDRWLDARQMKDALVACYADRGQHSIKPPTARQTAETMPEIAVDPTVCADGDVAVSVVFEPSMMHPDEIVVEIEDATGRKETFEVQSPSSAAGVDDLLQRLPAKPPRP
jgi:serine/threonine-protein kinase